MSFVDDAVVNVRKPLLAARFPFGRAESLRKALKWCVNDYYAKADIGGQFEARGIVVIGESRQGKTTEIDTLLKAFNDGTTIMPDGRAAKIVSCLLSGKVTWKDLGVVILEVLGYPLRGKNSQTEIWYKVRKYAELQGVIGIHFDECQHVFTAADTVTNQKILDNFKSLLKDRNWPLMLIFSGIPSLATHIMKEEQLDELLRIVEFKRIDLSTSADMDELVHLVFSYGDKASVQIEDLVTEDFLKRLSFAACHRWGLVIELLIEAFSMSAFSPDKVCLIDHFSAAFSHKSGFSHGYSPFTMPNYEDSFDREKMREMYEKTRTRKSPRPRTTLD